MSVHFKCDVCGAMQMQQTYERGSYDHASYTSPSNWHKRWTLIGGKEGSFDYCPNCDDIVMSFHEDPYCGHVELLDRIRLKYKYLEGQRTGETPHGEYGP